MLNKIRNFGKTIFAKILMFIIIVPFVFWGMGGVFSGGNTNNIAKINKHNVTTEDFLNFLKNSNIDKEIVRQNIDNNAIEELLSELISQTLLDLEIKNLNLQISDISLLKKIKENKNFKDEKNNFSRIKYEKFLLTNNISAPEFEQRLKKSELQKKLFAYVSGGIKPSFFLVNNTFKDQAKKLEIQYINLDRNYKTKEQFTEKEITSFINNNKNDLEEEYIDFSFVKITPEKLIGINEFNEAFYEKMDQLEDKILEGSLFNQIVTEMNLKSTDIKNLNLKRNEILEENYKKIYEKIYLNRNIEGSQIVDLEDYYILYEVKKIKKILPEKNNKYYNEIANILYQKEKFSFNQNLLNKINNKKFTESEFSKMAKLGDTKQVKINSIRDDKVFAIESIKLLYSLPVNSYVLINDNKDDIFLAKIKNSSTTSISKNSENYSNYYNETSINIRNNIYTSYDYFLNSKYKVEVNQKALDRVKNFFR